MAKLQISMDEKLKNEAESIIDEPDIEHHG